jgi:hypothetical protein
VDLILVETINTLREAMVLAELAATTGTFFERGDRASHKARFIRRHAPYRGAVNFSGAAGEFQSTIRVCPVCKCAAVGAELTCPQFLSTCYARDV